MTLTATWDEAERLDSAETILVNGWRYFLTHGQTPRFIAGLIETAVGYEPRLGLPMDTCQRRGCSTFVDERARDPYTGALHCSDDHRDADAEEAFEAFTQRELESGYLRRVEPSYEIDPMTGRWAS